MPTIFISYRRRDTGGHVGRLREDLQERYGEDAVFTDFHSIPAGARYREKIEEALDVSDIVLVVIGEDWLTKKPTVGDDVLREEVVSALSRDGLVVIPVLVEDAELPEAADLSDDLLALREFNACRLGNKNWDVEFAEIKRAIEGDDPREDAPEGAPPGFITAARTAAREHLAALLVTAAVFAAALFIVLTIGGDHGEGCENLHIPAEKRDKLSVAAGTPDPANEGVWYGGCGSQYWAVAEFPHQGSSVFIEENLRWRRIGPTPVECKRIPPELVDEWVGFEC
jgi:hypothetical protein